MTNVAHSSHAEPRSPESPGLLDRPVRRLRAGTRRILLYLVAGVPLGLLGGVIWQAVAGLPGYTVAQNGSASMSERGLTGWFSADFWFAAIGIVAGVAIGIWGWFWFGRRGWILVPLTMAASIIAALLCWWVGEVMGPQNFDERLSQAMPGDVVSIDLQLTALTALAAWPFGAILPVMIASAFLGDPEDYLRRWRNGKRKPLAAVVGDPVMPGGPRVTGQSAPTGAAVQGSEELHAPDH